MQSDEQKETPHGGQSGGASGNQKENRQNHYINPWELWESAKAACYSELGLEIRDDVKNFDGNVNYVGATEDRKGHKPIRVFIHLDVPQNVHLTDMKRGHKWTWFPRGQQPHPAEWEQRRRDYEAKRAEREAEKQARYIKRAQWAVKIWQPATPADGSHPYLKRKGVGAYGLRWLPVWERRIYKDRVYIESIWINDVLLVPMRDEAGTLWNLQFIFPEKYQLGDEDRGKDFLPGARVPGLFHWLGERTETVCLAEGYATAASIYEATGYRCFVAFSAGSLPAAALAVRAALPDAKIVICGDHVRQIKMTGGRGRNGPTKRRSWRGALSPFHPLKANLRKEISTIGPMT